MNGSSISEALYGDRVFQVRDIMGRKVLQRSSAEEVRQWLKKRPTTNYEVWELDAFPGDLKQIMTATEFLYNQNAKHKNS